MRLRATLALIGFTSIAAQIVLLRELLVASAGNELSLGLTLAMWLLWTALGSGVLGRIAGRTSAAKTLALLQVLVAVGLPASILMARFSRGWWQAVPGEILGPAPMLITAAASLAVFCPISGWMFVAGSRAYAEAHASSTAEATSSTYLLESVGSGIGGAVASIVLIRYLDALQIAALLACLNLLAAAWATFRKPVLQGVAALLIVAAGSAGVVLLGGSAKFSVAQNWRGFEVLATRNSPYGSLAVVTNGSDRTMIQNGVPLFTVPDLESAEEDVHLAMLEHPAPRKVLLIGGGMNGSIEQLLQYKSVERVDYVELDPAIFELGREYFPKPWSVTNERRVHIHTMDGRLFLKTATQRFDVILVNLPEPQTAQLNRFYTEEFFRVASTKLQSDGILSFQLHGAEEFIGLEVGEFLRCIYRTATRVFPEVVVIPGETVHFLASARAGILTTDPQVLVQRLREREVHTLYVREYFLPFRMAPERVSQLQATLQENAPARVNRDFSPIAYYFDIALWSTQFSERYRGSFRVAAGVEFRTVLGTCAILTILLLALLARPATVESSVARSASAGIVLAGMVLMGSEVLLLLGFQAIYGYVFQEVAILIVMFMAGMSLGTWVAMRQGRSIQEFRARDLRRLAIVQTALAFLPLGIVGCLEWLGRMQSISGIAVHLLVPSLAMVSGLLGGYEFPVATRLFFGARQSASAGRLYALDLAGASLGAIAITIYLLPVFGFLRTAEILAIASVLPMGLVVRACGLKPAVQK